MDVPLASIRCNFCMNPLFYAITWILFLAVAFPAQPAESSPRLVISEGSYIGYATVADALATMKAQGFLELPGLNGSVSFAESDNRTTWTFAGKGDPAYPAVVRYVYTRIGDVLHVEITTLCEAPEGPCGKFRTEIRDNIQELGKLMADPSERCRVNGDITKCGVEPMRKPSDQQIYVTLDDGGTCNIDGITTPCPEVAKEIRNDHPSDNPKVSVCAGAKTKYDAVGKVLGDLNDEYLTPSFGCPAR
jgi:hypothetical protein